MERWQNKTAVVTGASSGIGFAIAKKLVQSGINVVGIARRVERIEELSKKLCGQKAKLYAVRCDLGSEPDILQAFKWIKTNVGPISILINNAGLTKPTSLIDGDTEQWRQILDVNILALCICTREALKSMKEAKINGHIIHLNSVFGHQVVAMPEPILNVYPASKYAVTALAETLRHDLRHAGSNVKISSISPGVVQTEFQDNFPDDGTQEAIRKMPHLLPEDIANTIAYILSTPPHVQISDIIIRPVGEMF